MSPKVSASLALCGLLMGCLQQADPAYLPVSLPQPYASWAEPPTDAPIEPGMPVKLDSRQQEAVVNGVLKWMKQPDSSSFGSLRAVKHRLGRVVVCGEVNGRNTAGAYPGMAPFVGILMGTPQAPEFVVVNIAQAGTARTEVQSICQQSGIF